MRISTEGSDAIRSIKIKILRGQAYDLALSQCAHQCEVDCQMQDGILRAVQCRSHFLYRPDGALLRRLAYTLFLSIVVYRSIKIKDLPKILLDACETTAVIMFLIAGSNVMSFVMSFTGLPSAIGNALISVSSNKYVILLIINLVLLVVGCFMDITPAVLIFTPIFLPVVQSFGMDPIHFGIMMVMNLGIGNITPPVGSALFSGCSVADMDMEDMIKPILPFYAAIFVALMLVAYVPWFSMALPTLFGAV